LTPDSRLPTNDYLAFLLHMSETIHSTALQVQVSYRSIIKMTLPISFAILIPQINFITNNIFLGHYDASGQLLAVAGITGVYYLIFSAIGFGLNNGLQALMARRAGENRPEEIGKLFNQGIFTGMIIAAIGITLTFTITPFVFKWFITDTTRLHQAVQFSQIRIWGLVFLYIYQMRNALLVGTNQSRYLVWGALAETVVNILLDYGLIFGKWGLPEMGLNGAAIASITAEFAGMFVIFLVIHRKGIGKRFALFKDFRWNSYNSKLIFSMSAPLVFQHAISIISWEYFFLLIDSRGETALAVSNSMRNIFGIAGIAYWSFAATANAMVSNIIGQGKQELVWPLIGKIIRCSLGVTIVASLCLNLFPEFILSAYGQNAEFTERAIPVLRVVSIAILIMSLSVIFLNSVVGSGNSKIALLVEVFAIIVYSIYVTLVLKESGLSITYGWMSEWLYSTSLLVPAFFYMRSGKWKNKVI
jgi:MATE family multidrug resistance protein